MSDLNFTYLTTLDLYDWNKPERADAKGILHSTRTRLKEVSADMVTLEEMSNDSAVGIQVRSHKTGKTYEFYFSTYVANNTSTDLSPGYWLFGPEDQSCPISVLRVIDR